MSTYPLSIGPVTFDQNPFESPNGDTTGLSDLGSKQKAVVRELPGGIVTAQLLGSFPKPISWSGILWGSNAQSRAAQIQALVDNGNQVPLKWAQWSFDGFVEDFEITAKSWKELAFKILFRPLVNNNTSGGTLVGSDPFSGILGNAQNTMNQQTASPASGYTFPAEVAQSTSDLNDKLSQALQNSAGSVANIATDDAQAITDQVNLIQGQLQPLISGGDPIASSAAADLSGTVSVIGNSVASSSTPAILQTLTMVNPDIYQVAAQYYGDPTLYQQILDASGLDDPYPSGQVTVLVPALQRSTAIVSTVLNGSVAA